MLDKGGEGGEGGMVRGGGRRERGEGDRKNYKNRKECRMQSAGYHRENHLNLFFLSFPFLYKKFYITIHAFQPHMFFFSLTSRHQDIETSRHQEIGLGDRYEKD